MRLALLILASIGIAAAQQKPLLVLPQCGQPNMIPVTISVSISGLSYPLLSCVLLDVSSARIDTTTNPPTLRIVAPSASLPTFVDGPAISGVLDGSNPTFGLPDAPNPATSLHLYRNGIRLSAGIDFTLAAGIITFKPGAIPQVGDILTGDYRK